MSPSTAPVQRTSVPMRRSAAVVAILSFVALIAAACTPPPPAMGPSPDAAPRAGEPAYAGHGPYEVGVTTIQLSDRPMEVWYPVEPGTSGDAPRDTYGIRPFLSDFFLQLVPPELNPELVTDAVRGVKASDDGPFPLVLFAHGFASFRLQSTFMTTHLASWGFVVISPDFLDRGLKAVLGEPPAVPRSDRDVVDEAVNTIRSASATPDGLLSGRVDPTRVFPVGHSAGGVTAIEMLKRPDVPSAVSLASGYMVSAAIRGELFLDLDKPIMWVAGNDDGIVPLDDIRFGFQQSAGEKKLVELRSGHLNGFTDICTIGDGGIVAIARATGIPIPEFLLQLGDDGCPVPPNYPSEEVWPVIDHFVTAELRYRAGLDAQPVGLGDQIRDAFPADILLNYKHNP